MSNFQVFPPNCEVLLMDTAQREDDFNQQERNKFSKKGKKLFFLRSWAKIRVEFQKHYALHFKFGRENLKV